MKKNKNPIFGIAVAVALGLSTLFVYKNVINPEQNISSTASISSEISVSSLNNIVTAAGEEETETATEDVIDEETSEEVAPQSSPIDELAEMEKNPLMSIRAIGAIDAPVVIEEFSSFTCPHCAAFHEGTLQALKERYIDTGKVRLIFRDYPLNAPSLQAAGIARCMPEDQYYDFISVLFGTQEEWAQSGSPDKLMQTAKLAGLSDESLKACAGDKDLIKFILRKMQVLGKEYDIKSTPTFVFNAGEASLRGNRPVSEFAAVIEELLAKSE
jgi:protein-disulfide isomerase